MQSLSVYIDTLLICTCSAMMVLVFYVQDPQAASALNGMPLVQMAVNNSVGEFGIHFITFAIFAFAFSSLIGNYFYAENNLRFIKGDSKALLFVFREPLLRFFTGDDEVVRIGANFFLILAPSYFTFVFIEIFSGAIRGAGRGAAADADHLLRCVRPAHSVAFDRGALWPTMEMIAMNYPATWVVTALVFIVYYARFKWLDRCIRREHNAAHTTLGA